MKRGKCAREKAREAECGRKEVQKEGSGRGRKKMEGRGKERPSRPSSRKEKDRSSFAVTQMDAVNEGRNASAYLSRVDGRVGRDLGGERVSFGKHVTRL